jgi:ribosomal protein S18 acetylase RimI-like enzyme
MWINEVAVAQTHRQRGVGKQLLQAMLELARTLGCAEAWVLTDPSNAPAMRLYASAGAKQPPRRQVMFTFSLE